MNVVFDTGAFIALERGSSVVWQRLKMLARSSQLPKTHAGVIAQVWRGGSGRQTLLSRSLALVDVIPADVALGRAAGELLARSNTTDAIDALVVALANDGDVIYTSDPRDLDRLVVATGRTIDIVPV